MKCNVDYHQTKKLELADYPRDELWVHLHLDSTNNKSNIKKRTGMFLLLQKKCFSSFFIFSFRKIEGYSVFIIAS